MGRNKRQGTEELKNFSIRMPKDLWVFLKMITIESEESMADIVNNCLRRYKNKVEAVIEKKKSNIIE